MREKENFHRMIIAVVSKQIIHFLLSIKDLEETHFIEIIELSCGVGLVVTILNR